LAEIIRVEVLPMFEEFIKANKEGIADGLRAVIDGAVNAAVAIGKFFKLIADNIGVVKAFAALMVGIFVGTKVAAGIQIIATGIAGLITLFRRQAVAAGAAGAATALATGGASALSAAAGLAAFAAAAGTALFAINKLTEGVELSTTAVSKHSGVVAGHLADLGRIEKATAAANLQNLKNFQITDKVVKKTKEQIQLEQVLAKLRKAGITPTNEKDPIQLEAARLNLIRQNNIAEEKRIQALLDQIKATMELNVETERYKDLLQVLSDAQISTQEIDVLASKWNLTRNQVLEYIARVFAANATPIDTDPVVKLLTSWGLTKEEAKKYIDFAVALGDQKLSDAEIAKLMKAWGMTRKEVEDYAREIRSLSSLSVILSSSVSAPDFSAALTAINSYVSTLATSLSGITIDYSATGNSAATGWRNATTSLNAYLASLFALQNPSVPVPTAEDYPQYTWRDGRITPLAKGGFVMKPTLSLIGEAGPEAVIPLNKIDDVFSNGGFGGGAGGMTVNVTVQGSVTTSEDLANSIRNRLLDVQAGGGSILYSQRVI
jgi:hypothetical protein